jgi:cell division protein FtsB
MEVAAMTFTEDQLADMEKRADQWLEANVQTGKNLLAAQFVLDVKALVEEVRRLQEYEVAFNEVSDSIRTAAEHQTASLKEENAQLEAEIKRMQDESPDVGGAY